MPCRPHYPQALPIPLIKTRFSLQPNQSATVSVTVTSDVVLLLAVIPFRSLPANSADGSLTGSSSAKCRIDASSGIKLDHNANQRDLFSAEDSYAIAIFKLPASEMFGKKFWLGFLFGLLEISVLIWLIRIFGGYCFGAIALQGSEIIKMGLLYLVGFTLVGLFEEFFFRGYTQHTLAETVGFWPAALVLSLLFGSAHLMNPGEGWVGAASVVMIALFFCFSLKRTGSLWYAVGLHASFDWGETFLYSVPNSGAIMQGHLSNAVLGAGPKWLTGGTVGPEGSVFCFLTMALQFLVVMWLFPAKDGEPLAHRSSLQS